MSEFNKMVDFLDLSWSVRDQIVPCMIGPVGIGKTAAVHQHADNVGAGKVVTMIVSQMLPSEISGINMPDKETQSMAIYDSLMLSSLEDGDILFLDELFEGSQYVLSACLTLIESRMMMSGKILPDIQIIAATNPTIAPSAIKESIRQRFMFKEFSVDKKGTQEYIKEITGLDLPPAIMEEIETSGNKYNILSPRSLTKLACWMATAKNNEQAVKIKEMISSMWRLGLADGLFNAWHKMQGDITEAKVKDKLIDMVKDKFEVKSFSDMTIDEIVEVLEKAGCWEQVAEELSKIDLEDL